MIVKGNYYITPNILDGDFKSLLENALLKGAGKSVGDDGLPDGRWTPLELVEALSDVDMRGTGPDLRTVQHWFTKNERAIKPANIMLLSRVFGCGDPEATAEYQFLLHTKMKEFLEDRKKGKKKVPAVKRSLLPRLLETVFLSNPLNVPFTIFGFSFVLIFASYLLQIHDVTFDMPAGGSKQVGFAWAPNWTFLFLIFLPLYFWIASDTIGHWKKRGQTPSAESDTSAGDLISWATKVDGLRYLLWFVLFVCVVIAGISQWVMVRLLPTLRGEGDFPIDWGSASQVFPNAIAVNSELMFTAIAYLYMSICFFLYFAALILLFVTLNDFKDKTKLADESAGSADDIGIRGRRLLVGVFQCVILALFIAICMKAQTAYLTSNGVNIVTWLYSDIAAFLFDHNADNHYGRYVQINHFSSLVLVLAAAFVFIFSVTAVSKIGASRWAIGKMSSVLLLLFGAYILIGAFDGFAFVLIFAVIVAFFALVSPRWVK